MTSLGSSDERSILVRHFCRALRKPAVNAGRAKGLSASFCALLVVGLLVPALAEAAWTEPIDLSAPGQDPGDPEVAVDADGDAVFTWLRSDGTDYRIQARARSATGTLSAVQTLSAPGQSASRPQVAVDADGDAVFTWLRFDGAKYRIQARARSAGGTLSAVQTLSAAGQNAFNPQVAVDADGDAVFTWLRFDGAHLRVEARARSAAGTLSAVQTLSGAGQHASEPQVAVDGDGDAVFTWERLDGTKDRVQAVARSAAGTLSAVQTLSAAGKTAFNPQVAVDADGDAVFTWLRSDETDPDNFCCHRVQLRTRSTDGALSAVKTLSAAGKTGVQPPGRGRRRRRRRVRPGSSTTGRSPASRRRRARPPAPSAPSRRSRPPGRAHSTPRSRSTPTAMLCSPGCDPTGRVAGSRPEHAPPQVP